MCFLDRTIPGNVQKQSVDMLFVRSILGLALIALTVQITAQKRHVKTIRNKTLTGWPQCLSSCRSTFQTWKDVAKGAMSGTSPVELRPKVCVFVAHASELESAGSRLDGRFWLQIPRFFS